MRFEMIKIHMAMDRTLKETKEKRDGNNNDKIILNYQMKRKTHPNTGTDTDTFIAFIRYHFINTHSSNYVHSIWLEKGILNRVSKSPQKNGNCLVKLQDRRENRILRISEGFWIRCRLNLKCDNEKRSRNLNVLFSTRYHTKIYVFAKQNAFQKASFQCSSCPF